MDELQMISSMLAAPEPTDDMVERGRLALLEGSHGPARHRRVGLLAGTGLSLTAAAAAAVAVVVSQTSAPPTSHGPPAAQPAPTPARSGPTRPVLPPGGVRALSGQQVLLVAATSAAAAPERAGAYWYVEDRFAPVDGEPVPGIGHWWTSRDGTSYASVNDQPVSLRTLGSGFGVAHDQLTLAQLRRLPTDPAALARFVHDSLSQPRTARGRMLDHTGKPMPPRTVTVDPLPAYLVPSESAIALSRLLYDVPVPAAVRAAAFRALAALPGVRNVGPVPGGVQLRIPLPPPPPGKYDHLPAGIDHYDIAVDPNTGVIRSYTNYQGTTRILRAEWTNQGPPS
jgi:hypothetical protein